MEKRIIGIIPARYKSSRFPGKPLVKLLGKPMVIWVAELSAKALGKENVFIATEDTRIKNIVESNGFNAIITSDLHPTGTDRLSEVSEKIPADIYVNIQGDEPTVNPKIIKRIVEEKIKHPNEVVNAMAIITPEEDPQNINIPKVIFNENNKMIYMSRLPIPGYKSETNKPLKYYKQVSIYAFSKHQLKKFGRFGRKSKLEKYEDIEILRFLDLQVPVRMIEVEGGSYAVDIKEDVIKVEKKLKEIHGL